MPKPSLSPLCWLWLLLGALAAGTASAQDVAPPQAGDVAKAVVATAAEPATIEVWQRPVAVLRADLGSWTAEERARRAEDRILALPRSARASQVTTRELRIGALVGHEVCVGDTVVFALFEGDLDFEAGESLGTALTRACDQLRELLDARAEQRDLSAILRSVGQALVATLALLAALRALAWLRRVTVRHLRSRVVRSELLRVRQVDLRPAVGDLAERVLGVTRLVAACAALYAWLSYSLARFPYTAPWSDALGHELLAVALWVVHGVVGAIPGMFVVGLVFFVTRGTARWIKRVVTRLERRAELAEGVAPETYRATRRLAIVLVWVFGVVIAYPHVPGADSDAFKGISVLLGLMLSLGSAGLVNQLMSGFVVLYSRSVRSGEVVRIGEVEGQVTDLGLLAVSVLQPSGEVVSIPNALVVSHSTVNFSRGPGQGRAIAIASVTIGYDTPWRQVRALLLLAAGRTEGVVREPAPRVVQHALHDWYVEYRMVLQVEDGKLRSAVLGRLNAAIQDAFNEYGVQIMSPHFIAQPDSAIVVARGEEEPAPAPDFRFAKEAPPASFDPVAKAAEERANRQAEEAAKAERARLRAEREAAEEGAGAADGEATTPAADGPSALTTGDGAKQT